MDEFLDFKNNFYSQIDSKQIENQTEKLDHQNLTNSKVFEFTKLGPIQKITMRRVWLNSKMSQKLKNTVYLKIIQKAFRVV